MFELVVLLSCLGYALGGLSLWSASGITIVPELPLWVPLVLIALYYIKGVFWPSFQRGALSSFAPSTLTYLLFVLLLVSDLPSRNFTFLLPNQGRDDLLAVTLVLLPLCFFPTVRALGAALLTRRSLLVVQLCLALSFLRYADGRLIYSDDHPSFLYRLQLLYDHFPQIPFYNPDWNGGYVAREFVSTGALSLFYLSLPLLWVFNGFHTLADASNYTALIPYLFIFILPWSSYLAARKFGAEVSGAVLGAIFSLGSSLMFFEWLLKYGTLPFLISSGLLPLILALIARVFQSPETPRIRELVMLSVVAVLFLGWPVMGLVLVPAGGFVLHAVFVKRQVKELAIVLLITGCCLAPFIIGFLGEFELGRFLGGNALPGAIQAGDSYTDNSEVVSLGDALTKATRNFRASVSAINPLLLALSPLGFMFLKVRSQRQLVLSTLLWLVALCFWGELFKPQLELKRLVLPAASLLALLAGVGASKIFNRFADAGIVGRLVTVLLAATCVLTPLQVGAAYLGRTVERYQFAPEFLPEFVKTIREQGGPGRVFFLGFVLHELGSSNFNAQDGGHVAPLPTFAEHSFVASHFYHKHWEGIDPIPESYRSRGEAGIEEFLDLMNVTAVVTFRSEWTDYCRKSSRYSNVFKNHRFNVFTRTPVAGGYLLNGTGDISLDSRGITISSPSPELILKFRYSSRLRITGGELFPVPVFREQDGSHEEDVSFVGVRAGAERVRIEFR